MTAAHSILPPSGAAAWRRCAMWVTMNNKFPQGDTPESMEGTAAHWVFAEMLEGVVVSEGDVAPNGVVITEEMIDGAELFCDVVRSRANGNADRHIEERVAIPEIHEACFGTPDFWSFDPRTNTLEVVDYKFGHKFVEEFENDQGVAYIAGIIDEIAIVFNLGVGLVDRMVRFNFTIVQPRCYYKGSSVRTWSGVVSDLRAQINILSVAAKMSLADKPTATTNDECEFCPGRHACPAFQKAAYEAAEIAVQSAPVELSPAAASLELRMLERSLSRLQSRVEGLQETLTHYAKQGQLVPFHKLESSPGRQNWNVPPEQVIAMGQLLKVDLAKIAVVTPKEAAKKGVDGSVIMAYSSNSAGSVKLVPENPVEVRKIFWRN